MTKGHVVRNQLSRHMSDMNFWAARTPVHEAIKQGQPLELKALIENGACVNLVTVDSITPLHEASIRGQTQSVQMLLAAGAQVDARNIDGSTPLCDACAAGSVECVKLLIRHGAKVNPLIYTVSPLHEACMSGSAECVKLLIEEGANMEAQNIYFGTPLHIACSRQHIDCVKILLDAGANVNTAKLHETALHLAARTGNVDLITMLVDYGANVYAEDNQGKRPQFFTGSSTTPSSKCLQHFERTPLSLAHHCRVTFRKALGPSKMKSISQLSIAPRLIDFLCYDL